MSAPLEMCLIHYFLMSLFFPRMWSDERDEELINIITEYPWLYQVGHESYKNAQMKRNSWVQIASRMNLSCKLELYVIYNCENK